MGIDGTLHTVVRDARDARQLVSTVEPLCRHPDLLFTVQLLATELVANVIRHTNLPQNAGVPIILDTSEATIRLEVVDDGPGFDPLEQLRLHSTTNTDHHGLLLLNALADRWGFRHHDNFHIWFELDLTPGRRPWRGRQALAQSPTIANPDAPGIASKGPH